MVHLSLNNEHGSSIKKDTVELAFKNGDLADLCGIFAWGYIEMFETREMCYQKPSGMAFVPSAVHPIPLNLVESQIFLYIGFFQACQKDD